MPSRATVLFNGPGTIDEAALLVGSIVDTPLAIEDDPPCRRYVGQLDGVQISVSHNIHNQDDPRVYGRRWQACFGSDAAPAGDVNNAGEVGLTGAARRTYSAIARIRLGVTLLVGDEVDVAQSASAGSGGLGGWRVG